MSASLTTRGVKRSRRASQPLAAARHPILQGRAMRRWARSVVAALALLATTAPATAQPPVRIVGEVQWVAAARMEVMTQQGQSVVVDLMRADQSTYRALRVRD